MSWKKASAQAAALGMRQVWDLPVPYSNCHPVAFELAEGGQKVPEGAGKAWLYVEPDGDVLPAQGVNKVLGNLLSDPWRKIWKRTNTNLFKFHGQAVLAQNATASRSAGQRNLRRYLFKQSGLTPSARILEVGCAGGALLQALRADGYADLFGVDKDLPALQLHPPINSPACADGLASALCCALFQRLPVPLLPDVGAACPFGPAGDEARAQARRLAAGAGRAGLRRARGQARRAGKHGQAANPGAGQQGRQSFHRRTSQAALQRDRPARDPERRAGSARRRERPPSQTENELEWDVLAADLGDLISPDELERLHAIDSLARAEGTRVLHVPVYYACGRKA